MNILEKLKNLSDKLRTKRNIKKNKHEVQLKKIKTDIQDWEHTRHILRAEICRNCKQRCERAGRARGKNKREGEPK